MTTTRAFALDPLSPRRARRFVAAELVGLAAETIETIALMVSELATNAVIHGRSGFSVALSRSAREVRVEVADEGAGVPAVRNPDRQQASGRGLRLVDNLADDWGTRSVDPTGKTVWFVVGLRAGAGPASDGEPGTPTGRR
jgi:anti-sigma regulatory factor (Ser/Thr protein kinase)